MGQAENLSDAALCVIIDITMTTSYRLARRLTNVRDYWLNVTGDCWCEYVHRAWLDRTARRWPDAADQT